MSLKDGNNQNEPRDEKPRGESSREERRSSAPRYNLSDDAPILGDSLNTDDVKRFVELTNKTIESNKIKLSNNSRLTWTAIGLSSDETEYALDAAAIIGLSSEVGTEAVVMTLVFAGGKALPKQTFNDNRRVVKYSSVPSDQYDQTFKDNVTRIIRDKYPAFRAEATIHMGVLPVIETDLSDERLIRIGNEAINQVNSYIRQGNSIDSLSISALDLEDRDLIANIAFHRGDAMDTITELPHRADVGIDLELVRRERNRDNGVVNALAQKRDLSLANILGHVDLYYIGLPEKERRSAWGRRDERPETQIYGMNLVITKLHHNQTTSQMVLALAQVPALMQEQVLVTGLRPGGQNEDLRSYRALAFEIDADLDEIPEKLSDDEWLNMCGSVLHEDSQLVTIQIPEAGVSTPIHQVLVTACNYDIDEPARRRAADILIEAADSLSGDRFSAKFADDSIYDIGRLSEMPALLGTWRDERGQTRDLRDIGYYEILTHYGEKDKKTVAIWEQCLYDDKVDVTERLEQMEIIIADYTGGQYKITDRAKSVELNVVGWLYKLTDALREAGMVVLAEGITQDTSAYRRGHRSEYRATQYSGNAFKVRQRGGYGFGRN